MQKCLYTSITHALTFIASLVLEYINRYVILTDMLLNVVLILCYLFLKAIS